MRYGAENRVYEVGERIEILDPESTSDDNKVMATVTNVSGSILRHVKQVVTFEYKSMDGSIRESNFHVSQ